MARANRDVPPPLEGNDRLVAAAGAAVWAVALIVLLALGDHLPPGRHWWIWTCAVGVSLGLFAVVYVPFIKRSRAPGEPRRPGEAQRSSGEARGD
jgi:hypothetical protein